MGVRLVRYDRISEANGNGYGDHSELINKDLLNQHPIYAITGLQEVLNILEDADYDTNQRLNATNLRIDNLILEVQEINKEIARILEMIANLYVIKGVEDTYSFNMKYDLTTKVLSGDVKVFTDKDNTNAIQVLTDGLYVPKTMTEDTKTVTWSVRSLGETLADIFESGSRFSHNSNSWSNLYSASEANAWYWDDSLSSFVQPNNTNYFNGFITKNFYDYYTHCATLRSTNTDDDLNGIIIGHVFDENGNPHTLSLLVDSGGMGIRYGLVYDYYLPDQQVIFTSGNGTGGTIPGNRGSNWSTRTGITMRITKHKNIITAACSDWGSSDINEATTITLDLNNYSWGYLFQGAVRYGYCNVSQPSSYFQNISFESESVASANMLFAEVKLSEEQNNGIETKDDGLYYPAFIISPDSGNSLEERTNGYYVPGVTISSQSDNALKKLSDGTYYVREHSNIRTATKANHGFVVGDFIYYHPTNGYKLASAIDDYDSNIVGMVTKVVNTSSFEYMWSGFFATSLFNSSNGYIQGMPLYISDIDPGKVTQEQPDISKAVGYPVEDAGVVISIERGIQYNMEASIGDFKVSGNTYNVRSDGFIRIVDGVEYKQSLIERLLSTLDDEFKTTYLIIDNDEQTAQFQNTYDLYVSNQVPEGLNLFIKAF